MLNRRMLTNQPPFRCRGIMRDCFVADTGLSRYWKPVPAHFGLKGIREVGLWAASFFDEGRK